MFASSGGRRNPFVAGLIESTDTVDVALRDGSTAHLRPACRDDRAALRDFYQQLSPRSRYFRFFGKPRVDTIVEDVLKAVDAAGAFTLLAEIDHQKELQRLDI